MAHPRPLERNAPGQHHADRYSAPKDDWTWLRFPDGRPTGNAVHRSQLEYDDGKHSGRLRLDLHELVHGDAGGERVRLALHRGGQGYRDRYDVAYGHVLLSDLRDPVGRPSPSGGGRGARAPLGDAYVLRVIPLPEDSFYKPGHPGSIWKTYGDLGGRFGGDVHFTPLLWSFLNVAGGGMVRTILPDWMPIRATSVPRVKARSYGADGEPNGWVWGAYVKAFEGFGWIVWAHDVAGSGYVAHTSRP